MKISEKVLGVFLSTAMLLQLFVPSMIAAENGEVSGETVAEYINRNYSEDFSNDTSENLTLADKNLVNAANTEPEPYITAEGKLVISKGEGLWTGVNATIYNPSYYYTDNRYNVNINAKNELSGTTQYVTVYLNYQDSDNYYAVKISGSKWENNAYVHRCYVSIEKCVDGKVTQLCDVAEDAIKNGDFTADITLTDNIIGVYQDGMLVASAKDSTEVLKGGYVAFGTTNSRATINSVKVTMLKEDCDFSEDFSKADFSDGSWSGIVDGNAAINSQRLELKNGQNKVLYKNDWSVYGNKYELSYNVYNSWSGRTQYVKSYFNYYNANNYYYIGFSGASYTAGAENPYGERYLVVGKKINGTTSETEVALGAIGSNQNITLVSDGAIIKVYVGEALVYETEDSMNEIIGGYIGFSSNTGGRVDDIVLTHFENDKEYDEDFDSNTETPEGWSFYPGNGQKISAESGALLIGEKGTYLNGKVLYEGQKFRQGNYVLNFTGDIYASSANTMQILFNYNSDTEGYKISIYGKEAEPKLYKNGVEVTPINAVALKGGYAPASYKLIYKDGYIALFANGVKYLEYTDNQPVSSGYIGFGTGAAAVMIDDISINIPEKDIINGDNDTSYVGSFDEDMMDYMMSDKMGKSAYIQDGKLVFGTWGDLQNCTMYFIGKELKGSYLLNTKDFKISGATSSSTGTIIFNAKDAKNYYKLAVKSGEDGRLILYKATDGTEEELVMSDTITTNSVARDILIEYRKGGQIVITAAQKELINYIDENPIESGFIGYGATNTPLTVGGFEISSEVIVSDVAVAYDGQTPVTTLRGMSGKQITVKKRIINNGGKEEKITPIAVVRDTDTGLLLAIGIGESTLIPDNVTADEISASLTVPQSTDNMDLYLYLWKDLDKLTPGDFEPECVIVGETRNLFIMGDSMCADYTESIPQQGWGHYLKQEFDPHINATNFAVGGYRTSSVLDDTKRNNWTEIKAQINEGDYVLMGLGYNDRHDDDYEKNNRLTKEEYQNNLRLLYDECTALGATMIFVTPATDLWHYEQGVGMKNCGAHVALEMKEVAEEKGAVCLDLNTVLWDSFAECSSTTSLNEAKNAYYLSKNYLAGLGIDTSTVTWNSTVKNSGQDLVHFNDDGAKHLSNLIKGLLKESGLRLADFLK